MNGLMITKIENVGNTFCYNLSLISLRVTCYELDSDEDFIEAGRTDDVNSGHTTQDQEVYPRIQLVIVKKLV